VHKPQTQLSDLLRSCVQCGLCLPHCATYLASGNEVQSPRGRLLLLGDLLAHETEAAPDSYLAAFDQCIGCRACETVCPSGVPFTLMAHGQQLASRRRGESRQQQPEPAVQGPVMGRLDSVDFLRVLGRTGAVVRQLCVVLLGRTWRRKLATGPGPTARLARLLGSLPTSPAADADLVRLLDGLIERAGRSVAATEPPPPPPAPTTAAGPVMFFSGCANAGLMSATSRRLVTVLRRAGFAVSVPTGQECCGALANHMGRRGRAAKFRRRNLQAFSPTGEAPPATIVVEAAGCGLELKSYGEDFGSRIVDAVSLLTAARRPALRPVPLRVAFHDPCHARHGLGLVAPPRQLLSAIPALSWCEALEKEVCCGSGGAWGLRYPQLSADLARRKAADLAATGADLVVTTNPGCLGQIADGLALEAPHLPILPLTDLWWYATRTGRE